jgi:cell division protein FtsZ
MTPAAERMSHTKRMPRIDELPPPAQNEVTAAKCKARDNSHKEKRGTTLMQRLASVGLTRRVEKDEPNGACNSIDEDVLDTPTFLRRRATT